MTVLFSDLQSLGFTPNQTTIYLALAKAGSLKAGELIKKTGMHRNLVYEALEELVERRLVTKSRMGGVAVYKMLAPSRLMNEVSEKERIARQVIEELSLPTLTNQQEITVYEGIEGFRQYELSSYRSMKPKGVLRSLGMSPLWHEIMGEEVLKELQRTHAKKEFVFKGLAKEVTENHRAYTQAVGEAFAEIKAHPLVSSDTSGTQILDDRIAIRSFLEPYFVVEIRHAALAKNYQAYFDFLWSRSK